MLLGYYIFKLYHTSHTHRLVLFILEDLLGGEYEFARTEDLACPRQVTKVGHLVQQRGDDDQVAHHLTRSERLK